MSYLEYQVRVFPDGGREWRLNNLLHREDGPAVESSDGSYKEWWLHGKYHREDGPAIEWANGNKWWYLHGELHREDGPAIEFADGKKEFWLKGKEYSEKEFLQQTQNSVPPCVGKIVEIDGKKYKLQEIK